MWSMPLVAASLVGDRLPNSAKAQRHSRWWSVTLRLALDLRLLLLLPAEAIHSFPGAWLRRFDDVWGAWVIVLWATREWGTDSCARLPRTGFGIREMSVGSRK